MQVGRADVKSTKRLTMMFQRIHIELTNRCNFSCVFCPSTIMSRPPQDMGIDLVLKALDEIVQEHLTDTIFFHVMGEATLYTDLEKVIKETKRRKLKAVLTTNGWGLSLELLGKVLNARIDHILFSAQTPNEDSFKLRKAPTGFFSYRKKICSLIAKAIENGSTKVTLSFLTTPVPFLTLPSRRHYIISNKKALVTSFTEWFEEIVALMPYNTFKKRLCITKELLAERLGSFHIMGWNKLNVTSQLTFETRVLGDWIHQGLTAEKITRAHIGYCEGLQTHLGILSNGNIVFCCTDFDGKTSFGNIREISIMTALGQKKVQDAILGFKRLLVKEPYCQRCLGDVSFEKSIMRQVGSILYFKIYRPLWNKKREKEEVLV